MWAKYEAGASLDEVGSEYGVTASTVAATIRRVGGVVRSRNPGGQLRIARRKVEQYGLEIRAAYERGAFLHEIADDYGVAGSTIRSCLVRQGVEIRSRGTSRRMWGDQNPQWKGGAYIKDGYKQVWVHPDDPYRCMAHVRGYAPEHRLVMARLINRPLTSTETVHHIDGDRLNNAAENLQLRLGKHGNGQCYECAACGSRNLRAIPL